MFTALTRKYDPNGEDQKMASFLDCLFESIKMLSFANNDMNEVVVLCLYRRATAGYTGDDNSITVTIGTTPKFTSGIHDCYKILRDPVGNITSPGYPHGYRPNKHCEWRIYVGQGHGVRFKFMTFDLHPEVNGFCRHGYLQIGSMIQKGEYVGSVFRQCGSMVQKEFDIESDQCWIEFSGGEKPPGNFSRSFVGFHIEYERISRHTSGHVTDTNLTLLAMLLLLVPIVLPLSIYCYIKRLRNRARAEPEWKIYDRFKQKHYKKKNFLSCTEPNIQITVDPPSEDDEQRGNRKKDSIRPSGNYENYKSSDAELESLEVTTDMSNMAENESVFRQETPNFDQLFIVADRGGSIGREVNLLHSSTPFDTQHNRLYVSLLADSESLKSEKKEKLRSARASRSTGQIMSATSLKTKNGQPVLVLKEICKSEKYGNFLSIDDMEDVYKTKKLDKRKNINPGSNSGPKKSQARKKSKSVSSRKKSTVPRNDRVESLKSNEKSHGGEDFCRRPKYDRRSFSHGLSTLTVPNSQKRKFSLPERNKLPKASLRRERLPSKIFSSMRGSRSSTPAMPDPDYSSEPSGFHSAYFSARSQYDGHFFHEESPVNEEQLWILSEYPQRTSPLQRCFSDRFVGIVGKEGYNVRKKSSLSVSHYHRRKSAVPSDRSLHEIKETYSTPSFHGLPRINKENLTSSLPYSEGSTVLAGNIGSNSNEPRSTETVPAIPEIKITGVSDDNCVQGNDICSLMDTQMETTNGIDNLAFETSVFEPSPLKIYNKEEVDEIYNSRSSIKKREVNIDENNNKNTLENAFSWTVPNEFCPDRVIVLQQGESMV